MLIALQIIYALLYRAKYDKSNDLTTNVEDAFTNTLNYFYPSVQEFVN